MDSGKIKDMNKLCADITKVAVKHGYQADFSGFSEGRGCDFRVLVGFKRPESTPAKPGDLFAGDQKS